MTADKIQKLTEGAAEAIFGPDIERYGAYRI